MDSTLSLNSSARLSVRLFNIAKMGSTALPYMETKPKLIFFTDFDGTITVDDSM